MTSDNLCLYLGNIRVLEVNFNVAYHMVLHEDLLPYQLKKRVGNLTGDLVNDTVNTRFAFMSFLASRVLSLGRKYSKKILNMLNASQFQNDAVKAEVAIMCHAVSVEDNYWVKYESDSATWDSVNIRRNSLNRSIAQVALHGTSLSLQGELSTPEITTQGAYAKCWKRVDGGLWLYKTSENKDFESKVEIEVSRVLDKTNVNHVKYEESTSKGMFCCRCLCMSDDRISVVNSIDLSSYASRCGINFLNSMLNLDANSIYKMCIVDYLVANRDRHGGNWGCYYDSSTTRLLGCHPLFDHNNAFDREEMGRSDGGESQVFLGKSKREVALYSVRKCDFKFNELPRLKDFYYSDHYRYVISRAKDLKLI